MTPRAASDEKYILDLAAEVLAEPSYLWQHRFDSLRGDPGADGKRRCLPVDGYFPRHRLIVEYWEPQHSSAVPIMDEGETVSGVSRGHQRRLYDGRRYEWADAHGLRLVILDWRGFDTDSAGRLHRNPDRDRLTIARALRAAGVLDEPSRTSLGVDEEEPAPSRACRLCRLLADRPALEALGVIWQDRACIAFLSAYPVVYGHLLIAPAAHVEHVTGDQTLQQYLGLQRIVHACAEAVRAVLRPERVYLASLGSPQAGAHVQWHIIPCPPGLRPDEQQIALLDARRSGVLRLQPGERQDLVRQIQDRLPHWMRESVAAARAAE